MVEKLVETVARFRAAWYKATISEKALYSGFSSCVRELKLLLESNRMLKARVDILSAKVKILEAQVEGVLRNGG